jgi:hypothetical protein
MLYLTQHKRGQVISEQNNRELKEDKNRSNVPDWNGRTSGELNFNIETGHMFNVLAKNIFYRKTDNNAKGLFAANIKSSLAKELPIHKLEDLIDDDRPKLPGGNIKFEFKGSTFPYPDNIVTPMFTMPTYKKAKDLFDFAVKQIVEDIKNFGPNVIKQINIKGSADSAKPSFEIDPLYIFYTKKFVLDHDYGGEKKDFIKMNQFLADERANRMKIKLVTEIKEKTQIDISDKINVIIPGDNWYDPNFEGRKTSIPDVKTKRHGIRSVIIDVIGGQSNTPDKEGEFKKKNDYKTYDKAPIKDSGTFDLSSQGGPKSIPYQEDFTEHGIVLYGIEDNEENRKLLGKVIPDNITPNKLNGKEKVTCNISDDGTVTIDNQVWGKLISHSDTGNESTRGFITENPIIVAYNRFDGRIFLRQSQFGLITLPSEQI